MFPRLDFTDEHQAAQWKDTDASPTKSRQVCVTLLQAMAARHKESHPASPSVAHGTSGRAPAGTDQHRQTQTSPGLSQYGINQL